MMRSKFEVEHVLICDYFAQEVTGKTLVGGVYGSEIVFSNTPPYWPPLFLVASIRPINPQFVAECNLIGPERKSLFKVTIEFEMDGTPNQFNRILLHFPFPTVPFIGAGLHSIQFNEKEKKVHFKKSINVIVGNPPVKPHAQVRLNLEIPTT